MIKGLKRLLTILILFIGISFFVFLLIHMAPSDPASVKMSVGTGRASGEALVIMREEMGLNQPLLVQYGNWLLKFIQGDFGKSLMSDIPTEKLMIPAVMNTIQLAVITLIVSLGISIFLFEFPLILFDSLWNTLYIDDSNSLVFLLIGSHLLLPFYLTFVISVTSLSKSFQFNVNKSSHQKFIFQ